MAGTSIMGPLAALVLDVLVADVLVADVPEDAVLKVVDVVVDAAGVVDAVERDSEYYYSHTKVAQ
jgi:hypothetical protein